MSKETEDPTAVSVIPNGPFNAETSILFPWAKPTATESSSPFLRHDSHHSGISAARPLQTVLRFLPHSDGLGTESLSWRLKGWGGGRGGRGEGGKALYLPNWDSNPQPLFLEAGVLTTFRLQLYTESQGRGRGAWLSS